MITLVKSRERGYTNLSWLKSYHSFSFGEYYDPNKMHLGPLRVLNDDIIQPGSGFPTHPHSNMEIVTIVFEGAVAHNDSTGGKGLISANEIQRMTAGSGIMHSEFNASDTEVLKLIQIWFLPNKAGHKPSYEQKKFSTEEKVNKLLKVVSGEKSNGVIYINQDAEIYLSYLEKEKSISYKIKTGRGIYIHLFEGEISVNENQLISGDAVKIINEPELTIASFTNSKLILFDMNME